MTIQDNIAGRLKAEAALDLLMADLDDSEVRAAMTALRAHTDAILGPPDAPEPELSTMTELEAKAFRAQNCLYHGYLGEQWRDIPRDYIATIADFGLELQRYLRSELGKKHQ